MVQAVSGKFVVRIPRHLHLKIKSLAAREKISLNELCVRSLSHTFFSSKKETFPFVSELKKIFGLTLKGVIIFGSVVKEEDSEDSDTDILIVLDDSTPIQRNLYSIWDEKIEDKNFLGHEMSPQFSHIPSSVNNASSIWYEVALASFVIYEQDFSVAKFLNEIRACISQGYLERKMNHGHPYWIKKFPEGEFA